MSTKQHKAFVKKIAKYLQTAVKTKLNLLGIEAALLTNLNLFVSKTTLLEINEEYKKLLLK